MGSEFGDSRSNSESIQLQPGSKSILQQFRAIVRKFTLIFRRPGKHADINGAQRCGSYRNNEHREDNPSDGIPTGSCQRNDMGIHNNISSQRQSDSFCSSSSSSNGEFIGIMNFSFEDIRRAAKNFSPDNMIGEGGMGTVFKGKLKDGSLVAIKRARKDMYDGHSMTEFKNEILALSKIEHLNLVRLYGYVEYKDERMIVMEYVGNGTLREHLDGAREQQLELAERLDIAIDIAHGITYLHTYSDPPIIHRDIKASNILITEKLKAKVADFGLARILPDQAEGATHVTTVVKGTMGYLDPEYLKTYQLNEKSDVYSFGVLLVELVTGRYPLEPKKGIKERVTIRWAMQKLRQHESVMVMDPRLRRSPASTPAVHKVLKLSQKCLDPIRESRPTMRKCAEELWTIRKEFQDQTARSKLNYPSSHQSDDLLGTDARKIRTQAMGIEEDDRHTFISA